MYKQIIRKFIDSLDVSNYEIETDKGWKDITKIHKTIKYDLWKITTASGLELKGADDHILFDKDYNEIFLKDLQVGDYIQVKNGIDKIVEISNLKKKTHMYDVEVNSEDHRYFSNNILSHNTQTMALFLDWYMTFHSDKTSAICANKGKTAREVFSRVYETYRLLPQFIKCGVYEFNKSSIHLENGSRVLADATSESGLSGYTINGILFIDEVAKIPSNIFEPFYTAMYPTISRGDKSRLVLVSTPLGLNHFYQLWEDARKGVSKYKTFSINWDEIPGRDEEWRKKEIATIGEDRFSQEYNCVVGKSLITVKNKLTKEVRNIKIEDLLNEEYK